MSAKNLGLNPPPPPKKNSYEMEIGPNQICFQSSFFLNPVLVVCTQEVKGGPTVLNFSHNIRYQTVLLKLKKVIQCSLELD